MGLSCIFCDEFPASAPDGTCAHCESLPGAPLDERGDEPGGEAAQTVLYRIVHVPTGRLYVGVHGIEGDAFREDGYMGSGPAICAAVEEDPAAFRKDVLLVLDSGSAALEVERGLVGPEQVASGRYFNLCVGGGGPVGLCEESKERHRNALRARELDPEYKARHSEAVSRASKRAWAEKGEEARAVWVENLAKAARELAQNEEWREAHAASCRTPEARERNGEVSKRAWANATEEQRAARVERAAEAIREATQTEEWREAHAEGTRRRSEDPTWQEANAAAARRPETRQKKSAGARAYIESLTPAQREARTAGLRRANERRRAEADERRARERGDA